MKGGRTPIHLWRSFCPSDLLEDELVRLLAARGNVTALAVYLLFLPASHRAGGDLPSDRESLAALLGLPQGVLKRGLAPWLQAGKLVEEDGRIFHRRVRREVEAELDFREREAERKRKEREVVSGGRPPDIHRTSEAPTPLRRDAVTPGAESRTERSGGGGPDDGGEPSGPSRSVERDRDVSDATAAAIEQRAVRLAELVPNVSTSEWITRASRIEGDATRPPRSFSDPRRRGLSEAWAQSTLRRLDEHLAQVARPIPL
jgi:hypothetical protein